MVKANELLNVIDEIPISPGAEVEVLPAETAFTGEVLHLNPENEQNAFTEAEVRTVKLEGDELVFAIEFEPPLDGDVKAKVWLKCYREDTPFGEMPKIFIKVNAGDFKICDGGQELHPDSVKVSGTPTPREVRVPLALLGNPEWIMLSAHSRIGNVTLDNIPWVFLSINNQ